MKKVELKKKAVNILNKIKKELKKLWSNIKKIAKKAWDKFMELPKKIRLILYVWVIIIFVLLIFILATNGSKKFYTRYETFENSITERALRYVKDKGIYTTKSNKLIINLETLKEEGYVDSTIIDDDTCEGITVVYYDDEKDEYIIDSYLNCKRYTSKYYWDFK